MKFIESAGRRACWGLFWTTIALCVLAAACTKSQPKCTSNAQCTNPAYPFCDVNGQFAASGGEKNVCTIVPPNCPVATCGCSPGAARCGSGDELITCDPGGMSESTTTCDLGCTGSAAHCAGFTPLNGLGPALESAGSAADLDLSNGGTINTSTGVITTSAGVSLSVPSVVISQNAGQIRAFYAHSIHVGNVRVTGTNALALVSATDLTVDGKLDASAANTNAAPGSLALPNTCAGANSANGGGGGGNATTGGGAGAGMAEGALDTIGLVGGCNGGAYLDGSGNVVSQGGGGGGAVELLAGSSLSIGAAGVLSLGGGGGAPAAGGASGGNAVLESPKVSFAMGAKIVANGGGGGACGSSGEDAHLDMTAAAGAGPCGTGAFVNYGGAGGTATTGPGSGRNASGVVGGGGAVGRLYVRTRDGSVADAGALISAVQTSGMLTVQ